MTYKKYFATFMAFVVLLSSLGATGYERYCCCTGEILNSVFINSKSDCCNHTHASKPKSCCSAKKLKLQNKNCSLVNKKCCNTKISYSHFDGEAPFDFEIKNFSVLSAIPVFTFQNLYGISREWIYPSMFLILCYKFTDLSPPFYISGRDILRKIQISRC